MFRLKYFQCPKKSELNQSKPCLLVAGESEKP